MATDDARDYVLAFENDKEDAAKIAAATATKLQNGETKLLDVVKALGEYITSEDDKIRTRAVNYLTAVITALPPKYLSRQQIQVLNSFLCSRIEDGGAIEGLTRLQGLDRFTSDMAQELLRTIVEHFSDLQSLTQSGRYKVYSLLNELLSKHRKSIRDMGDESLVGTVQVVSGEKDPRNLMLIFSMLRVFMIEWDISSHAEKLFDAVYAYFPITFRPPPNDPYGITAQDLKDRLKECLAATGALAPQTFPNLLDRLDSTSDVVKRDVLQALAACALNYDPQIMSSYSITLWDAVKFEVLQAQEPFLAEEALAVIKSLAICLSRQTEAHAPASDPLVQYLKPVNKECLEHLQEPASRQAKASGDILKAAASGTLKSFQVVLQGIGPALFTLQQSSEGINNQRSVLTVVNQLFDAALEVYGSWLVISEKNPNGQENLLMEFKERLIGIYSRALMSTVKEEVSYRLTAAKGLLLLAQMRGLLLENETGMIVQHFNDIVLDEESYGRDELKSRAMEALAEISKFWPRLISDITFPKFIARLPDSEEHGESTKDYESVLECLAQVSAGKDLLQTLVRRLMNRLKLLIETPSRPSYPYTCAILSTIYFVLNRGVETDQLDLAIYFESVSGLVRTAAEGSKSVLQNETVLNLLGRLLNLIIRRSPSTEQDLAAQNVYALFTSKGPQPLDVASNSQILSARTDALILSTYVLAALPKKTMLPASEDALVELCKTLATTAETQSPPVRAGYLKQISLLANKHINSPQSVRTLIEQLDNTITELKTPTSDEHSQYLIRLIFALATGLVLRLVPQTTQILTTLVSLLSHDAFSPGISLLAALGFSTILTPDPFLTSTNQAVIRLLAPQRVFQTLTPLLSTQFRNTAGNTTSQRETYLIALSGILGSVSSDIVMPELPTLLPLLLQSLEISDANHNVKRATLETMLVVITKNPDALIESGHIPSLVRRLLATATLPKLSRPQHHTAKQASTTAQTTTAISQANPPAVRLLAAKCLTLLPTHVKDRTPNPLLSLKKEVLQGLMLGVLDDPRRDVRKEGVDARASWTRGVDWGDDSDDEDD